MDGAPPEAPVEGMEQEGPAPERERRRRHRRRHSNVARNQIGGDPFQSGERDLFDLTNMVPMASSIPRVDGEDAMADGSRTHLNALPPPPGGDPRRLERTQLDVASPSAASVTSRSSSSSSSTDASSGETSDSSRAGVPHGHHWPIRRDAEGHLVIEGREDFLARTQKEHQERRRRRQRRHLKHTDGDPNATQPAGEKDKPRGGNRRHHRADRGARKEGGSKSDTVVVVGGEGQETQDNHGSDEDSRYDYDPDDAAALSEKALLLANTTKKIDPSTRGGLQPLPSAFQAAPIPYWVQRLSDLLLFHNAARSSAGPSVLPVDSALAQLRADLKEARQLLAEVKQGKDWGFLRTRTASMYEVYGPDPSHESGEDRDEGEAGAQEMKPILEKSALSTSYGESSEETTAVEVHVRPTASNGNHASTREDIDTSAHTGTGSSVSTANKDTSAEHALLPPDEEALDESRPLLQREIPLWRRRGAAAKTLAELIDFLEDRLGQLEKKLRDPVHGCWYEAVGAPNSSGVDGTQRTTLPPAIEQAYATAMTNAVLSDLFVPANHIHGLGERAARMSSAFAAQTPKVHDQFVVEEDFRPLYDYLLVKSANAWAPPLSSTAASASASAAATAGPAEEARRSFTVHVDYIRLHPGPSPGLLVLGATETPEGMPGGSLGQSHRRQQADESFSRLLTGSQRCAAMMTGDPLEDTLMAVDSLSTTVGPSTATSLTALPPPDVHGAASADALAFGPASAATLSILSVATAQKDALVPFTPEAYLIATLLQHYERYRLLRLNLLPNLKNRGFYEEQLAHLAQQRVRTTAVNVLQGQLEALRDKAAELERTALTAMIALWRAVLHLRGVQDGDPSNSGVPFVVASHRAARAATLAGIGTNAGAQPNGGTGAAAVATGGAASELLQMVGGEVAEPTPQRRNVQEMEVLSVESSSPPSLDDAEAEAATHSAMFTNSATQRGPSAALQQGTNTVPNAAGSVLFGGTTSSATGTLSTGAAGENRLSTMCNTVLAHSATRAPAFRFYLRRLGRLAETPYVEGDDVLLYEPVVEGTDALPKPQTASATAAEDRHDDNGDAVEQTQRTFSKERLDALQFFQVVVFARASAAVPPQYVGCTMPRPLTTAKVAFFNESFEIRVLREPIEIILHVIAVSHGPAKGNVVATVRLQPTLTRGYLLLPLQAPVSFVFKKRFMPRYTGTGLTGVMSASTTWTTAQGLSIAQVEQLFMSGAADPLNPEFAPMLRLLKKYYQEIDRNEARRTRRSATTAAATAEREHGRRRRARSGTRMKSASISGTRHRDSAADTPSAVSSLNLAGGSVRRRASLAVNSTSAVGTSMTLRDPPPQRKNHFTPEMLLDLPLVVGGTHGSVTGGTAASALSRTAWDDRLLLLRHRWLIQAGQSKALDQVEANLLRCPIPLFEDERYALLKAVKRDLIKEAGERRDAFDSNLGVRATLTGSGTNGVDTLFDERAYAEEPSSVSGLALSPLPKETKLKLWQDRQRHMKLTRKPARHISDEEKLGQLVTIPKFSLKLVLDLKPRSQFNPRRVARPKNEDIDRELLNRRRDSRIVVHVMKANNLPERADGSMLEPFVQVSFVYENAYSRCEVGTSPTWFQSLEMPFQPLDFEEETLSMIDDDIVISVYDKVEIPMPPATVTTGAVAHETHYRTERRLLGTLRLPFYSLHQAPEARMEGVFPLMTPRWLLGYDASSAARTEAAQNPFGEDPTEAAASDRSCSTGPTLQLYMSLWPPLQREKPKPMSLSELTAQVRRLNVNVELHYLHEVALKWAKTAASRIKSITSMNAQASARQVEPFVNCSTGDLVLSCRYLLPHGGPPPPETVTNIFEAIRFVSLLPFVVDIMTWEDKDVWSTNVELLAMRNGDYEELALLLAHFLRYLDPSSPTYVVVGEGEIYAQTIMVLRAFDNGTQWRLIDPRTGWIAPVERPFGTILRDIHYVISHDQLWANIQLSGLPHRMTWDLNNPAHWLPCFDPKKDKRVAQCMPALTSIQREVLTFPPADRVKAKEIEVDLRAALRKSLLAWRNHRPPAYHRSVEAILRDLLVLAEDERCACGSVRHPAVTATARERLAEYFGLPVDGISFESPKERRARKAKERKEKKLKATEAATEVNAGAMNTPTRHDATDERGASEGGTGSHPLSRRQGEKLHSAARRRTRMRPCVRLVGAPVTSSYSTSDKKYYEILQQVFACAAHEVGTDDVSFAAGVYVKSYTGDVFAMWVFLVAICRGVEEVSESDEEA